MYMALIVVACGRIDFAPRDGSVQTPTDTGDLEPDAGDVVPLCNGGPFGPPTVLPGPIQSPVDDWTPAISTSNLTLVFYSQRVSVPGAPDIWISTRASDTAQFPAGVVLAEVSSSASDHNPHLTADELELVLTSNRAGGGSAFDVYAAKRATTSQPFGAPIRIDELSSSADEESMWISGDGLRVMTSANPGSSYDLYFAERPDRDAPFSTPMIVMELSTGFFEGSPALSADELEIFFISNRPGGIGAYDVWRATRATRTSPFTMPTNVASVSSTEDEWGLSLSADGRTLFYSYSESISGANAEIWTATRECL